MATRRPSESDSLLQSLRRQEVIGESLIVLQGQKRGNINGFFNSMSSWGGRGLKEHRAGEAAVCGAFVDDSVPISCVDVRTRWSIGWRTAHG